MANILYRETSNPAVPTATSTKGQGLTNAEIDGNFKSLSNAIDTAATYGTTQAVGTNNTTLATTAFVRNEITTGTGTTQAVGTNNTTLATTAFVQTAATNKINSTVYIDINGKIAGDTVYLTEEQANNSVIVITGDSSLINTSTEAYISIHIPYTVDRRYFIKNTSRTQFLRIKTTRPAPDNDIAYTKFYNGYSLDIYIGKGYGFRAGQPVYDMVWIYSHSVESFVGIISSGTESSSPLISGSTYINNSTTQNLYVSFVAQSNNAGSIELYCAKLPNVGQMVIGNYNIIGACKYTSDGFFSSMFGVIPPRHEYRFNIAGTTNYTYTMIQ